jgi:hypothetical protein
MKFLQREGVAEIFFTAEAAEPIAIGFCAEDAEKN